MQTPNTVPGAQAVLEGNAVQSEQLGGVSDTASSVALPLQNAVPLHKTLLF